MARTPTRRRDLVPVQDTIERFFDRFFDERIARPSWFGLEPFSVRDIPLDMVEEGDTLRVKATIPGIAPDDLHVEVTDDTLHIWGEAKEESERDENDYLLKEHRYGRVERTVSLPCPVDSDGVVAEVENGTLTVSLPKAPAAKGRDVPVQSSV